VAPKSAGPVAIATFATIANPAMLGPDQSHHKQSRLWSRLHATLAQITQIILKWMYAALKIFSPFKIF